MLEKICIYKWEDLLAWITSVEHKFNGRDNERHTVAILATTISIGAVHQWHTAHIQHNDVHTAVMESMVKIVTKLMHARMLLDGTTISLPEQGKVLVIANPEQMAEEKARQEGKTFRLVQHLPAYVDADCQNVIATSKDDLLDFSFVHRFSDRPGFHQFAASGFETDPKTGKPYITLVAELDEGYEWFVVGYIHADLEMLTGLDFPHWVPKYREAEARQNETMNYKQPVPLSALIASGVVSVTQGPKVADD
jgi:hypothetical protein